MEGSGRPDRRQRSERTYARISGFGRIPEGAVKKMVMVLLMGRAFNHGAGHRAIPYRASSAPKAYARSP